MSATEAARLYALAQKRYDRALDEHRRAWGLHTEGMTAKELASAKAALDSAWHIYAKAVSSG